jgi:site-specific DNA recombinase
VLYCRVSTKEQVDEGNSLSTQEKNCKDYATKNGYEIAEIFTEQGESAKTADRTQLQKMLLYCADKKKLITAVIVYKIDRLSRNTDDYSQLRLLFKKYGVEIKSTSEYFENTPQGKFMENMFANVAQFDNDVRAERCSGGMREAVREGRWVWGAPVGYRNAKVMGKSTIVHSETAPLILKTFEMLSFGIYPVNEVLRVITKEGLRLPSGKPLGNAYFHHVIRNKIYYGLMEMFGEKHMGKFEPIVSEELFNQVQRVLNNNGHKTKQYKTDNPDFPLRKFVKNENGKSLTGYWSKGRSGEKYPFYRFISAGNYRREDFTNYFCDFLDEHAFDTSLLDKLKGKLREQLKKATGTETKDALTMEGRLVEIKQIQNSLIQKNMKGVINDQLLKEQLNMLEQEISEIQVSLTDFKRTELDPDELFGFVEEYLLNPSKIWRDSDLQTQKQLQWFEFPQGIVFQNEKLQTTKVACVFKTKEALSASMLNGVDPTGLEPATSSLQMRRSSQMS